MSVEQQTITTPESYLRETINRVKARAREWLRVAGPDGPSAYVLPSSTHFLPYYTHEFFNALNADAARVIESSVESQIEKIHSPDVQIHSETNVPDRLVTPTGKLDIQLTAADTIAKDGLISLLDPRSTTDSQAKGTYLVTSIDQLLASYFAKPAMRRMEFNGRRHKRATNIDSIYSQLEALGEGSTFRIAAAKRKVEVTILPLPKEGDGDGGFKSPYYSLIIPEESDFSRVLSDSQHSDKSIIVGIKANQLELGLAYLMNYKPVRIATTEGGESGYKVFENGDGAISFSKKLSPAKGLDFIVFIKQGNVDGEIRNLQNSLVRTRKRDIAGIVGLDVVQTGRSNRQHGLKVEDRILPIPCYPVGIRVV